MTKRLPIPNYLQDYIIAGEHDKPQFPKMSDNKTEKTDNKTEKTDNKTEKTDNKTIENLKME